MCLKKSFKMTTKKVLVTLEKKTVKVTCSTFNSLLNGTKSKFNLSADAFHLEYFDDSSDSWITLCDDEDMEDVLTNTKIRVILKEADIDKKSMGPGSNYASHGAAAYHGNAQYVGGNVSGKMVGRDYIDGDKITATNMAKVGRHEGTMHIGGSQTTTNNKFSGAISGDQLHFGVGGNIKH